MVRLKVLFLTTWFPTENDPTWGIFVKEHAKAVSLYDDVVVIHQNLRVSSDIKGLYKICEQDIDSIRSLRVDHRKSSIPRMKYLIFLWSSFHAFKKVLKSGFQPDIIHVHIYQAGVPGILIGKTFGIPVIITELFSGFPRRAVQGLEKRKARFAMNRADRILPVSKFIQKSLESYGIKNHFQVVPNAVNTNLFYPNTDKNKRETKRMLLICWLAPKKGVSCLLNALAKIRGWRRDFFLDVLGDGPYRDKYDKEVKDLNLEDKVKFHGVKPKSEVAEFMRRCDFLVSSSLVETFGITLIEALACGKPVVTTDSGGPTEFINEEVGKIVPPEDVDSLAEAIDSMLDNCRGYSSEQIAHYAKEKFSYEVVGKQLDEIYRDIVK